MKGNFVKRRGSQFGLTLHELMISVTIVTILLSLAAPSYSQFLSKRKVAGAANLIGMYVENIKMQAIKRNEFISISYKKNETGTQWCIGATSGNGTACDCLAETPQCLIDAAPSILSEALHPEFSRIAANFIDGTMTFDPVRGILSDPGNAMSMQIRHEADDYQVNVSVNATGTVRKCTPAGLELVGYPACI